MHFLHDANGGVSLKYVSLVVLCLQNSTMAILMRLSRVGSDEKFNTATAVLLGEVCKVAASIFVMTYDRKKATVHDKPQRSLAEHLLHLVSNTKEMMKIGVPAGLYLIQNNLQYVSISNLDAATFQVLYQLKVLTTAIFSVTMLGKTIVKKQWLAILGLMCGVALVQWQAPDKSSKSTKSDDAPSVVIGLLSVLAACLCSGFAGVYFEKILKNEALKVSIWERNIQLGVLSIGIAIFNLVWSDYDFLVTKGFFYGYRPIVWVTICVNAFGGLLTAVVVKYADNILKSFATSIAIVISVILSIFLFDKIPTLQFAIGAMLVNASVYMYGSVLSNPKPMGKIDSVQENQSTHPIKPDKLTSRVMNAV